MCLHRELDGTKTTNLHPNKICLQQSLAHCFQTQKKGSKDAFGSRVSKANIQVNKISVHHKTRKVKAQSNKSTSQDISQSA